jgi:hypothetical protein
MQTTLHPTLMWFLPTFHGDIRLEKEGPSRTLLRAYELTASEEKAMASLRSRAISTKLRRKWATEKDFLPLTNSAYRSTEGVTVHLDAKIEDVQAIIAKALKPQRKLLTAVRFTDGRVEEVHSNIIPEAPRASSVKEPEPAPAPAPVVATTVATPVRGCPMPNFPEADIRASRVLEHFLTPIQIDDYRKTGSFVTTGADTGRRYLVCNRERPTFMQSYLGGRQLFDLDQKRPICIHDWSVPPPEEMLALHLHLTLPLRESELLALPDIDNELAMADVDPAYRPRI